MADTKPTLFHIADIISVVQTSWRPLMKRPRMPDGTLPERRDSSMAGIYEILHFMTGHSLSTHELCRAADACRPHFEKQFPFLREIGRLSIPDEETQRWREDFRTNQKIKSALADKVQKFINTFPEAKREEILHKVGTAEEIAQAEMNKVTSDPEAPRINLYKPLWETAYERSLDTYYDTEYYKTAFWPLNCAFSRLETTFYNYRDKQSEKYTLKKIRALEKQYGAYHDILPLEFYRKADPAEEARMMGFKGGVLAPSLNDDKEVRDPRVLFNISIEDAFNIRASQYPEVTQGILALANKNIGEICIEARDIKQAGDFIEIGMKTLDFKAANKIFDDFMQIMPRDLIDDYTKLGADFSADGEYVIQIDAAAMKKDNIISRFKEFVNQQLDINTPPAGSNRPTAANSNTP